MCQSVKKAKKHLWRPFIKVYIKYVGDEKAEKYLQKSQKILEFQAYIEL